MADVVQIKPCKAVYVNVTSVIHSGKIITWLLHFFTTGAEYEDLTLSNLQKRLYFYTINNSKKSGDILLRQAFKLVWVPAHRTAKKLCTVCLSRSVEYINDLCITEYEWLLPLATLTWATAGAVYLNRLRNWTCRGFCGVLLLLRLLIIWKSHIAPCGYYHCHLVDIYHLFYFFFIAPGRVMFTFQPEINWEDYEMTAGISKNTKSEVRHFIFQHYRHFLTFTYFIWTRGKYSTSYANVGLSLGFT